MYTSIGKCLGNFKQKKNKEGNFYFVWEKPNHFFLEVIEFPEIEIILMFSSNQFWDGMSNKSENGNLMYPQDTNNNLVKLSSWRKQIDGTIFAHIAKENNNYGILLIKNDDSYLVYWAFSINEFDIDLIQNNPISFSS